MKPKRSMDRRWLLATARDVAEALNARSEGTSLRIRRPRAASDDTGTDGWRAPIGDLGQGQPRLEIWLDKYAGYPERKLSACFYSREAKPIRALAGLSKSLWPIRELSDADMDDDDDNYSVMKERLGRAEFNEPVLENYERRHHFFGFYDPTRETESRLNPYFRERAVDFFLDVARALPKARSEDAQREVYPQCENREWVAAHLKRERRSLLATECKIRDDYECQVCRMRFEDVYGTKLGSGFAEAHHKTPLGMQPDKVMTHLEDLITVCANCHRMLHRMEGKPGDITRLRAIVKKHRKRKI
jgi:5-methylcytosine-specific restriction endonuclease McrA